MIPQLSTFAWIHTGLSLIAIVAGVVVLIGLLTSRQLGAWTALFLATAAATSATGFGFRGVAFGASHWVGVISLVVLAVAVLALYVYRLAGAWRWVYAVSSVVVLYFLTFVLVAQIFKKVPRLEALAPTLSEPPFAFTQLAVLLVFAVLAIAAARTFRAPPAGA